MLSQMFTPKLFYRSGFNVTNAADRHAINLQMELIGCDNYDLDESKSMWGGGVVRFARRPGQLKKVSLCHRLY